MKTKHPALDLFSRLFQAVADTETPALPTYYVPMCAFRRELEKAGIPHPDNVIAFWNWTEEIGLKKHVSKVIAAHHRARGTKPTPMELGARRLDRRLKKHRIG